MDNSFWVLQKKTSDGAGYVAPVPPDGSKKYFISSDFCDKTSWFYDSAEEVDDTLTDSGNGLLWNVAAHTHWIDMEKVSDRADHGTTYDVVVKVDTVEQSDGYVIDYTAGTVTFDASQAGKAVTVTYHYAQSNKYSVKADYDNNKKLQLANVKLQFTKDIVFPDGGFIFKVWAEHGGGLDTPAVIKQRDYKTLADLISYGNNVRLLPAMGGVNGFSNDIVVLYFYYMTTEELLDSTMEHPLIPGQPLGKLWLEVQSATNTDEIVGEYATVTYYCYVEDVVVEA